MFADVSWDEKGVLSCTFSFPFSTCMGFCHKCAILTYMLYFLDILFYIINIYILGGGGGEISMKGAFLFLLLPFFCQCVVFISVNTVCLPV